jgi:hypothetical protein
MANAKNSDLDRMFVIGREKFGPGAGDPDAQISDELQAILEEKGLLLRQQVQQKQQDSDPFGNLSEDEMLKLDAAGYGSPDQVREASVNELKEAGLSASKARKLKESVG